ncbi:putative sorting nexin-33 [Apostichopus japonicus]|uniref:Putative sorting nexin-33 n=1 Tax=Stichopus japonicus TaxID=307972 RepID=A0A2G8JQM3_STIJA|nr:putative sorting nexin-33 [Apostichopus japonicus]
MAIKIKISSCFFSDVQHCTIFHQAKVLYDFEGEAGNGELTVYENDVVTIIRQNVGDGWWEAETDNGQRGLVPEAWMEIITAPQSVPATPNFDDEWDDEDEDDDWDDGDSETGQNIPGRKGTDDDMISNTNMNMHMNEYEYAYNEYEYACTQC